MISLRAFFSGCWFGKHDYLRTRNQKEDAIFKCHDCGAEIPILAEAIVKGPAHQQAPDLGAIRTKAKVVRGDNVREFRQSER